MSPLPKAILAPTRNATRSSSSLGSGPGVGGPTPSWQVWLDYKAVGPFWMHTKRVLYTNAGLTEPRGIAIFGDLQINTGLSDRLFTAP